jgi:hypothetical protein
MISARYILAIGKYKKPVIEGTRNHLHLLFYTAGEMMSIKKSY